MKRSSTIKPVQVLAMQASHVSRALQQKPLARSGHFLLQGYLDEKGLCTTVASTPKTRRTEHRNRSLLGVNEDSLCVEGGRATPYLTGAVGCAEAFETLASAPIKVALGMVIPKRWVKRAIDRNRIKRQIRAQFQHALAQDPTLKNWRGYWLVRLMRRPLWLDAPVGEFRHNCRAEIEQLLIVPQNLGHNRWGKPVDERVQTTSNAS